MLTEQVNLNCEWSLICMLFYSVVFLPLVLWCCWLGGRTGIWPVKNVSGEVLAWLSVWSEVGMICMWFSWCHCHPIISCSGKIQNGLPFWCQHIQVVLEKRPLNGCNSVVVVLQCSFITTDCWTRWTATVTSNCVTCWHSWSCCYMNFTDLVIRWYFGSFCVLCILYFTYCMEMKQNHCYNIFLWHVSYNCG